MYSRAEWRGLTVGFSASTAWMGSLAVSAAAFVAAVGLDAAVIFVAAAAFNVAETIDVVAALQKETNYKMRSTRNLQHPPLQPKRLGLLG